MGQGELHRTQRGSNQIFEGSCSTKAIVVIKTRRLRRLQPLDGRGQRDMADL